MTRWIVTLSLVIAAGCFTTHDGQQAIDKETCNLCHMPEYAQPGTALYPDAPLHNSSTSCTLACAQCHTTDTWSNSLGGCDHPETATPSGSTGFPLHSLGTQHTQVKCIECHSSEITAATGRTSKLGANTDCLTCHPNSSALQGNHVGVVYETGALLGRAYAFLPDDRRFCLDCHPQGLAIGHGKTNPFRLPHHNARCAKCHDNASGLGHQAGADVLCVTSGCHDGNGSDRAHHQDLNHHPGCLKAGCHPDGRKHD